PSDHGDVLPLAKAQLANRNGGGPIDVPTRVMPKQLSHGFDPEGLSQDLVGGRTLHTGAGSAIRQTGVDVGDGTLEREWRAAAHVNPSFIPLRSERDVRAGRPPRLRARGWGKRGEPRSRPIELQRPLHPRPRQG